LKKIDDTGCVRYALLTYTTIKTSKPFYERLEIVTPFQASQKGHICENKRTQCSQLYLQEQGPFPSTEDQGPPVFE
jgi:hypothetical protein